MKNRIVFVLSLALCITYIGSASASVKRKELVQNVQSSIEKLVNEQYSAQREYKKENKAIEDKSKVKLHIHEYALQWGKITALIPEDNIDDQAAEWIKESVIGTAVSLSPDPKGISNDNSTELMNYTNTAKDIFARLTNQKLRDS